MKNQFSNLNDLWTELMVEELVRNGARFFCMSSGSRSTPLVLAVAANSRTETSVHPD